MRILILHVFYNLFISHSLLQNGVTGYGVGFLMLIREIKIKLKRTQLFGCLCQAQRLCFRAMPKRHLQHLITH